MPRNYTAGERAALRAGAVSIAWLLELQLAEETIRLCTLSTGITYNSETYDAGVDKWRISGRIGSVSNLVPEPITITFDGGDQYTDNTITRNVLTQTWHLRPALLTGLLLDPSAGTAIGPFMEWRGIMDNISVSDKEDAASSVIMTLEGGSFRALSRNDAKCADADQRLRSATDTFFKNTGVKPSQNVPFGISWSKVAGGNSNNGGGGGGGGNFRGFDGLL